MKKFFALVLMSSGLFYSCSSDNVDLAIDNPGEHPIIVMIDSLVVEVPGRQVAWVEMGKGEHQVKLENDSIIKYIFTEPVYFLNPTLTKYLKTEVFYGSSAYQQSHISSLPVKTVTFLGIELEGNYDVITDLITPVTWDYGPREIMPEMVELDEDEPYAAFVKLSDPMEILEQIRNSYAGDEE